MSFDFRLMRPRRPIRSCAIFKEAHLVSSHNVQFSFRSIDGVTRDAVFTKLISSIDYSFTARVFNDRGQVVHTHVPLSPSSITDCVGHINVSFSCIITCVNF